MVFVRTMEGDDEELSFIHIAAATANVVRYLQTNKQQNECSEDDGKPGKTGEEKSSEHRAYVEKRLRDLAAFERRVSGK